MLTLDVEPDKAACQLASMSREELVSILRHLACDFPLDFSDEFLTSLSVERLRHVTLAAYLHSHQQQ